MTTYRVELTAQQLDALLDSVLHTTEGMADDGPEALGWTQGAARALGNAADRLRAARSGTPKPARRPHRCTSCQATIGECDRSLVRSSRPCCGQCEMVDTHGDTVEAAGERMAALRDG